MTLINDFLKRISIAEILTVIFIFSVGISLLYKYGFYEELGISWYIFTLSPQQLFLSSISLILFSTLGIILGVLNSFYNEKYWEITFLIFSLIMFLFVINSTLGFTALNSGMYLFVVSATLTMSALNITFFSKKSKDGSSEPLDSSKSFFNKSIPPLFSIILVVGLFVFIYFEGKYAAERISFTESSQSIVNLKNNHDKWILIEMNGDKVLMMKDNGKKEFKIVEYKEIESFEVN